MLNITQPTLCRWETGDREPDFVMLEKLCRFFDVSADYLLGIENEDGSKNTEYEFNYQHKNTKLIHKEKKI
jgi:transcriptional regulator with XRE-family HTH domain